MGCDGSSSIQTFQLQSFNPRTRMGCDGFVYANANNASSFQSTHPHGVRRLRRSLWPYNLRFQSTHPHGVRPRATLTKKRKAGFNPRTRMGCDTAEAEIPLPSACFNPRTRMGCDDTFLPLHPYQDSFNPRTRMGCDVPSYLTSTTFLVFQSTHPHGVRRYLFRAGLVYTGVSIHAPAWGATP